VDGPARSAGGGMRACCKWRLSCTHSRTPSVLVGSCAKPFSNLPTHATCATLSRSRAKSRTRLNGLHRFSSASSPSKDFPRRCFLVSALLYFLPRQLTHTCTQHTSQVHRLTRSIVNSFTHSPCQFSTHSLMIAWTYQLAHSPSHSPATNSQTLTLTHSHSQARSRVHSCSTLLLHSACVKMLAQPPRTHCIAISATLQRTFTHAHIPTNFCKVGEGVLPAVACCCPCVLIAVNSQFVNQTVRCS
jgi:hypothetical protein